mmetsp:Transcript_3040/g.4092  ORF Transcript_3040/g.4092 Transcript_3040/m.4092 type:complete len:305 (+) Transcript_3040:161-1075(+)|eukprot:CAMPEP_0198147876 /NCGR_PEP_ID=MMETSP1443-20131203/38298_1 /TAXON_ID=186043 /ORGANISM="Entomoneis sp., Strain CCMP2396" /LENGTH=304 /DNA_ID=CAMNT_0043812387 /DNA_START=92 /DNA_END=1006 /DNA_ORIENTATION=-
MGGSSLAKNHPWEYLGASAMAATLNYPLWRASAVGQSGFVVSPVTIAGRWPVPTPLTPYVYAFMPPYKGCVATVLGMTWARAAIFGGSDYGKSVLKQAGFGDSVSTILPPLVISTLVQCVNMPLVRSTISLQNPQCEHNFRNVSESMSHIYKTRGLAGLWHGTSAGILKSVPKYCTAVVVKDAMEEMLPQGYTPTEQICRSALKSAAAGLAGAALTNPFDVVRNEMFKSNQSLPETVRYLYEKEGLGFLSRGLVKNLVAVSIPVGCTIFFTDALIQWSSSSSSLSTHSSRLHAATRQDKEDNAR